MSSPMNNNKKYIFTWECARLLYCFFISFLYLCKGSYFFKSYIFTLLLYVYNNKLHKNKMKHRLVAIIIRIIMNTRIRCYIERSQCMTYINPLHVSYFVLIIIFNIQRVNISISDGFFFNKYNIQWMPFHHEVHKYDLHFFSLIHSFSNDDHQFYIYIYLNK